MKITVEINVSTERDRDGETEATENELATRTRDAIAARLEDLWAQFRAEGVDVSAQMD